MVQYLKHRIIKIADRIFRCRLFKIWMKLCYNNPEAEVSRSQHRVRN